MRLILTYFKPLWKQLLLIVGFTAISVWATLKIPAVMSQIIDQGILSNDLSLIIRQGLWMLALSLADISGMIASDIATSRAMARLAGDLRLDIFRRIESFSLSEIDKFSTASLITRSTNDVQQVQQSFQMVLGLAIQAPIMIVGAVIGALRTAPSMTWLIVLTVAILLVGMAVIFGIVTPKYKVLQDLVDRLNLVARENLAGLRVIRAFNNESIEERKFDRANTDKAKLETWVNRITGLLQSGMSLVVNLAVLAIIWVGAHLIVESKLEIGSMMAFLQYAMMVVFNVLMLAMVISTLPRARVSAGRIATILETKCRIVEPTDPEAIEDDRRGELEFRHVTFSYPGAESAVLNDVSFTARPGGMTAIIGSTASGKSTLVNLIPRLYDVTSGQILIGGHDIRRISRAELVKALGFVPQRGVLFSGTVAGNIKYADEDISDKEMRRAAKIAQADFIEELDGKYKARIAQGGNNVSGGQKQRLSIARAIAKDPDILVFDDSFSALDYQTDAKLRRQLMQQESDKTILIVTQRISTIKDASQIIVLDKGKVVGIGTHHHLLNSCSVYREIAGSQFSDSEMKRELEEAKYVG
ncbi:ABC transporter ATP-binding protein [Candidatus Nanoperiomorbus periodonticus]|uniref:ABC transporter ATP-binding protein n=1 Tax=Candidatus Nanoperiomorbus periodonticus TaxID=2171989 RepID=UPI00101D7641|nr:ABC transporter ATP-binding protein [Candidatus Nanoperiomorbus periodonticus]RYC75603.1 putative ABC transporter ATP-binding protein [Candidatus Nanoperiomorbus periodonticus]